MTISECGLCVNGKNAHLTTNKCALKCKCEHPYWEYVNKIEEGVVNCCKSLDDKLTSKLTTETTSTGNNDHSPIDSITAGVVDEQREQEKRKLNLIFHNVRESTKEDGPSRKTDDIATITTMLQNRVGIKATVTNAFRLGKK